MNPSLIQQIFGLKLGFTPEVNSTNDIPIDLLMGHDGTATIGLEDFKSEGRSIWDPSKVLFVCDHFSPPATIERAEIQKKLIDYAKETKTPVDFTGICHQLLLEHPNAYAGQVIIGADSHTVTSGALGAFATGVGTTDFNDALATGKIWLRTPEAYKVEFTGEIPDDICGKDLALKLLDILGNDGAIYKSLEYYDYTDNRISQDSRATISNMSVETGAKCGIFYTDEVTLLNSINNNKENVQLKPGENYTKTIKIDCSKLQPLIAVPHDPGNIAKVEDVKGTRITQAFIGSCTGGRLEDLAITAEILEGKNVDPYTKLVIIPASKKVYLEAAKHGYIETMMNAGVILSNPSCGPCCNIDKGLIGKGEACISTSNRNFQGRMGSKESGVYLASPYITAASAVTGKITHPRDL